MRKEILQTAPLQVKVAVAQMQHSSLLKESSKPEEGSTCEVMVSILTHMYIHVHTPPHIHTYV